ncbi:MAG: ABC transporter substrate-binding protein [Armatimonadota bacterium]|nr:ABC transporter substrate-binding protein [Armatimonadota bacterium]MDR7448277.1 ABC transporter substrate-binding protein [Armatimonadota bacterium]MDR7458307.1 ABC transporter substrate-binding protein [Armatimonadota bacterium]MDR7478390.1 ABC transporter substrate-binding protein [Armatimonadota bacterium]MDR7487324.1 ABC transporter substrate-binding protein [Armatimonadota bacterium]
MAAVVTVLLSGMFVPAASVAQTRPTVTIRLSWKIKGEFAPLFVAVQKGFYTKRGVSVRVLEGAGAGPTLTALANGNDEFAYVGAIETAQGVSQDMPIVMVANYIRKSPMVLASFGPLASPRDLEGKSVGTSPADTFQRIWPAFARANGIDESKVRLVNLDPSARLAQFLQGRLDVLSAFYTNEVPVVEVRAGRRLNLLWVADHGFNILGHGLVTSLRFAEQNPQTVRAVVAGTNEGFEYTLRHPVEASDILVRLFPDALDRETTPLQISFTLELVRTRAVAGRPLGWNSMDEWRKTVEILARGGLLQKVKAPTEYFTNRFVGD